ncbi:MAG: 23S rRNA (guanosine(2251)-2'-O)-methyltransferase RlmB [Ruminococcaceae bacterium]|nr:23S rRNA (guanosine(2251)-2'-O)-methyltransferase RlmB [Oscillospiraceae bacterium]
MEQRKKNFHKSVRNAGRFTEETGTDEGMVIGRNAVRELLRSGRDLDKLFVQKGEREGSIVALIAEAAERRIPIVEVERTKLDQMSHFAVHQGIVAMAAQKEYCTVDELFRIAEERGEKPFLVIADGITDPNNLGALIRCAEGVGAHGLIIPKRRSVGVTSAVSKASCGAIEHLAIAKVTNLAATVEELKQRGVWIFAAEAGGDAYYDTDFNCPCALIMGSEGEGVSHLLKERADYITSIPMYGRVNSFNVSTAASVILSEIARQHRAKT